MPTIRASRKPRDAPQVVGEGVVIDTRTLLGFLTRVGVCLHGWVWGSDYWQPRPASQLADQLLRLERACWGQAHGSMFEKPKETWRCFKESNPGHRFKDRFHRHHRQSRSARLSLTAALVIVAGILIVLLGGVVSITVPVPGAGWLLLFLGLGMVAGESKHTARLLDWVEVKLRRAARWALASRSH